METTQARRADRLRRLMGGDFRLTRGVALPLGATLLRDGINFALFAKHATDVTLVLFSPGDGEILIEFPLDARCHRTGDIWHAAIHDIHPRIEYGWRCDRIPIGNPAIHTFDRETVLLDPYAKKIVREGAWGSPAASERRPRRCVVVTSDFDWEFDQPLETPFQDTVIYELGVRGFTSHPTAGVTAPGTYAGLIEKIPYLTDLGVTAVELLPVHEFEETNARPEFDGAERLVNLWGYQPIAYFAPNGGYASAAGEQVSEFKQMVKAFHRAGIEVILDVVFNHTGEGGRDGITWSFRGIDNSVYYMLRPTGEYLDFSGCGNTLNCNHPVVHNMISDCLRYWVMEMHVDGFRFDLASILGRGRDGEVLSNPPLLEHLANDPVLARTKLIAEAWDAGGLYQVGTFPAWGRWAEWNGKFRDDIRRFVKGDEGMVPALATRLCGSPDLYQTTQRRPYHSINFVTCHDGFTLADLVSFNSKHNLANGEGNRDGSDANYSWNCGVEGQTDDPRVLRLRIQQQKNFAAILLIAAGVPMILAGDEFGRTQHGNNNAYCQDNETGWVDWSVADRSGKELLRFFRLMIGFRKRHDVLRGEVFDHSRISWHGIRVGEPDWSWNSHSIAMHVSGTAQDGAAEEIYFIANAHWESHDFELPRIPRVNWVRFVDTSLDSPDDIADEGNGSEVKGTHYTVAARSTVILARCL